jgi:quercetin dioxygenase-like cupin family protein
VTIVSEGPDLLAMDVVWPRAGHRAAAHVHPEMEERYEVRQGTAAFRVGDEPERTAGPGETVVVPPGTRHLAWNPTDGEVRLRIEMRPALRWAEFVERLFSGEDGAALLREYAREIRL